MGRAAPRQRVRVHEGGSEHARSSVTISLNKGVSLESPDLKWRQSPDSTIERAAAEGTGARIERLPQPRGRSTLFSSLLLLPRLGGRWSALRSSAMASEGEDGSTPERESFKLLGILDVKNIPCARDSVLYGSLGGLTVGLGHFLATSRVRRSCDFGVGGFILTTLGCWFYCRYNNAKLRIQQRMIKEGMKNRILYESTQFDPEKRKDKD